MNCGDDENVDTIRRPPRCKHAPGPDPMRRKVMSILASMVDKHRRKLEKYDQVVITICLDWREGTVRETVMGISGSGLNAEGKWDPRS